MPPTFDEIYAECHRHVHALCVGMLGNTADAQDAMQETFLAVAQALPSFRGESSAKTWVHRIAVRVAVRHRARRRDSEPLDERAAVVDPIPEHAETDAMMKALAALPFEHRLVLALFAIAGLTHAEIADTLGVPEGTVWSRLHHAKRKLAELVERDRDRDQRGLRYTDTIGTPSARSTKNGCVVP
ncbi:MAG TPA: RNA polymerase sigma factor [Kofleriaceae bacterium]|nr:RNA polymerase sigma factor [Kofleriaceae bacterium]